MKAGQAGDAYGSCVYFRTDTADRSKETALTAQQMDLVMNLATWGSMSQQEREALLAMIALVSMVLPTEEMT